MAPENDEKREGTKKPDSASSETSKLAIAEILLDLGRHPEFIEKLLSLKDADARRKELLKRYTARRVKPASLSLLEKNLTKIRVEVEAELKLSDGTVVRVTAAFVTF